jgi:aspartate aminotransferase
MTSIGSTAEKSSSIFYSAPRIPADPIFALTAEYVADTHPQKVNLGQGAYRDDKGQPFILPSVRESRRIINEQGLQHEYLPILGLKRFRDKAAELVLGSDAPAGIYKRVGCLHFSEIELKQ